MSAFDILLLVCALGCGLMAGVFFAFSTSVMGALGRLPPEQGMAAMQTINVVILNPLFLGVFMGTGVACTAALAVCFVRWGVEGNWLVAGGAVLYLGGSLLVTMRCNVPRNNLLARLDPVAAESVAVWRDYLATWTAWNHVRAVASLAAAACFVLALR